MNSYIYFAVLQKLQREDEKNNEGNSQEVLLSNIIWPRIFCLTCNTFLGKYKERKRNCACSILTRYDMGQLEHVENDLNGCFASSTVDFFDAIILDIL